jgi:tetratricopeptide (TPR) repeat protein
LYHFHDFENAVTLQLQKELRKGRRTIDIASLFPNSSAASIAGSSMKEPVSRMMLPVIDEQGVTEAIEKYRLLKASERSPYDYGERVLNMFGIELVYAGRVADAIEVFKLVVEEHPRSANAYDSLAWAYMKSGQAEPAILNYEKSLELNPKNTNAVRKLEELRRQ